MSRKKADATIVVKDVEAFTNRMKEAAESLKKGSERNYAITSASIKDDLCNYTFEISAGVGSGDVHNVKGQGLIEEDMREAFARLNVHLAIIDDAFKNAGITVVDADAMHGEELTTHYTVTGFKVKGSIEDASVILIGSKWISLSKGRMEIETPKISISELSGYPFLQSLQDAVDNVREEVALYKEGKYTKPEPEEANNHNQLTIQDQLDSNEEHDTDFDNELESGRQ